MRKVAGTLAIFAMAITGFVSTASADGDAPGRVAKVVGKSKANRIAKTVSKRMSRSATITNQPNDPVRVRTALADMLSREMGPA